jgi:hypothetical protein
VLLLKLGATAEEYLKGKPLMVAFRGGPNQSTASKKVAKNKTTATKGSSSRSKRGPTVETEDPIDLYQEDQLDLFQEDPIELFLEDPADHEVNDVSETRQPSCPRSILAPPEAFQEKNSVASSSTHDAQKPVQDHVDESPFKLYYELRTLRRTVSADTFFASR